MLRRPFSPWVDCVVWLFTGWLAGLAVALLDRLLQEHLDTGIWIHRFFTIAANIVGMGAVVLLGLSTARDHPVVVLSLRRPPWRTLPWVALSALSLSLLTAALNSWFDRIFPMPPEVVELFQEVLEYHSLPQFLAVVLFLVVVAPATEELMFRGLFVYRLAQGYGRRTAILGSALCFGIFHLLPWQAIGAALAGVYLAWLVLRTRSIFIPMAAHALYNLVPVAATGLAGLPPTLRGLGADPGAEPFQLSASLLAGATAALAVGILGTLRATRDPSAL